jgi:hypothetical protein
MEGGKATTDINISEAASLGGLFFAGGGKQRFASNSSSEKIFRAPCNAAGGEPCMRLYVLWNSTCIFQRPKGGLRPANRGRFVAGTATSLFYGGNELLFCSPTRLIFAQTELLGGSDGWAAIER